MGRETPVLDVPQHILEYLDAQPTLTLATASRGGVPRATTLTYVNDGPSIYVWTRPDTTTARQMEENPVVSFAIDQYAEDWHETKGIQAPAEAQVVLNPTEAHARRLALRAEVPAACRQARQRASPSSGSRRPSCSSSTTRETGTSSGGGVSYQRDVVFSVFRDLPKEEVETVAATLQTVQVGPGDVIVRQGAPADKFFIIVDGEVEVVHEQDGATKRLATLTAGQFFGEMAILRDSPRMATVRALGTRRRSLRWTATHSAASSRSRWARHGTSTR